MKNNKKMLFAGLGLAGAAALGVGTFAFLSSESETRLTAKTGTVSMTASASMEHSYTGSQGNGISNVNPGDNDPTVPSGNREGNDHEVSVSVSNTGNKSILTRNVIKITVTNSKGTALDHHINLAGGKVSSAVLLFGDSKTTPVGDSKNHQVNNAPSAGADWTTMPWIEKVEWKEDSKTFIVYTKPVTLNGTGENAETESGVTVTSKNYKYDLGLSKNVGQYSTVNGNPLYAANANALNALAGNTINVTVDVQAMQYRNTSDSDWETIFTEEAHA